MKVRIDRLLKLFTHVPFDHATETWQSAWSAERKALDIHLRKPSMLKIKYDCTLRSYRNNKPSYRNTDRSTRSSAVLSPGAREILKSGAAQARCRPRVGWPQNSSGCSKGVTKHERSSSFSSARYPAANGRSSSFYMFWVGLDVGVQCLILMVAGSNCIAHVLLSNCAGRNLGCIVPLCSASGLDHPDEDLCSSSVSVFRELIADKYQVFTSICILLYGPCKNVALNSSKGTR